MYEIEIIDINGCHRPGSFARLYRMFPEAFRIVAKQGETINIICGLKPFTLRPLIGDR